MSGKLARLTVTVAQRQSDLLNAEADRRGISLSEAVRRALDVWIDTRHSAPPPYETTEMR